MDLITALLLGALLVLPFSWIMIEIRNNLISDIRGRAIEQNHQAVIDGPSYYVMLFDLRKWTYKQFYPDLA